MPGYVLAHSACFGCGLIFSYNPHKVPSIRASEGAPREPICQSCVDRANPERKKRGLPPIEALPGAYDAIPENEL